MMSFDTLIKITEKEEVIISEKRFILDKVFSIVPATDPDTIVEPFYIYTLYDKREMRVVFTWKKFKKTTEEEVIDYIHKWYGKYKVIILWKTKE